MYLNQAVLGEAGAVGADGFPLPSNCRALIIYGDEGQVLKRAVSGNKAQAAEAHVRSSGCKLTGPWVNGVAPIRPKKSWEEARVLVITLVVLVLLFAGCSAMMSGPKSKPAMPDKYGAQSVCEKATRQQLKWLFTDEGVARSQGSNGVALPG